MCLVEDCILLLWHYGAAICRIVRIKKRIAVHHWKFLMDGGENLGKTGERITGSSAYVVGIRPSPLFLKISSKSVHNIPRDALCAIRGIATVSRPSLCMSVCPSVTLIYRGYMCWFSSKIITRVISLGSSLIGCPTSAI